LGGSCHWRAMTPALTEQKTDLPNEFDRIAGQYDVICSNEPNYKKHMRWSAERLVAAPAGQILDVCCGTGLSSEVLLEVYPKATLTGLDASNGMLDVARQKPQLSRATFVHGDAMDPMGAGCTGPYDAIFLAYGIRNLPQPDRCLEQLHRLLVSGGRLCFHEYSVRHSVRSQLAWHRHWMSVILPAALRTDTLKAHYYLWRSVNDFEGANAFCDRLRSHGFINVRDDPMDGDVGPVLHSFTCTRN
jgi:ubiquinone/menaquinone biosynthesis C-methylase UbiE